MRKRKVLDGGEGRLATRGSHAGVVRGEQLTRNGERKRV